MATSVAATHDSPGHTVR